MKTPRPSSTENPRVRFRASCMLGLLLWQMLYPALALAEHTDDVPIEMEPFLVEESSWDPSWDSDPIDWVDTSFDDWDTGGTGGTGGPDAPEQCTDVNAFTIIDGNARRSSLDLRVFGAVGKNGLSWRRYHSTVASGLGMPFGKAGGWRHSWQFELKVFPLVAGESRPHLQFSYPAGQKRVLLPAAGGVWSSDANLPEQAVASGTGYDVETDDGTKITFEAAGGEQRPIRVTDPHGVATVLAYDAAGRLVRVTEAAGRFLTLAYRNLPVTQGSWATLASASTGGAAVVDGGRVEFVLDPKMAPRACRYYRVIRRDGAPVPIASFQCYAPGASTPLSGQEFVSSSKNVWALDLGAVGAAAVGRVVAALPAGAGSSDLVGAVFQGYAEKAQNADVIASVTTGDGRTVTYDYDVIQDVQGWHGFAALTRAVYDDATTATYRYERDLHGTRPLLVEADEPRYEGRASRIRYSYQSDGGDRGMIHEEINPTTGRPFVALELDKSDKGRRTLLYSDDKQTSLRFDMANRRLLERKDSLGRASRFVYDAPGIRPAAGKIDHRGRRTDWKKDGRGRLAEESRDNRRQRGSTRDAAGRPTATTDRSGRVTRISRDGKGRIDRVERPDGTAESFTYNSFGQVTSHARRSGGTERKEYDARGLLTRATTRHGTTWTYAYDAQDRVSSATDASGKTFRYTRDAVGRVTKITRPDGTSLGKTYDRYGRKIAETDSHGRTASYVYDELSRLIRQTDFDGRVTQLDYAEFPQGCGSCTLSDRPTKIIAPDGSVTTMLYDTEGRLLSRTVATGTSAEATTLYAYDDDDNLIAVTDPLGRVTRNTYDDEHHRLTSTDPLGLVTRWTYDDDGHITKIVAPDGGVTTFTFDTAGRPISSTDAAGNTTRTAYDANGRVASITDARRDTTRFTYDDQGRKIATTYADGKRQTVEYDAAGRPLKTGTPDGVVTTTTYDAGNRPLSVTRTIPGASSDTTTYVYDTLGHRIAVTDPLGRTTRWSYDARGNTLTVTGPDGNVSARNTYDAQNNLLTTTDAAGGTTTYTYDAARNQTSLTDAKGNLYRFTYDALRRKTAMIYPDGSQERWSYDLAGNPTAYTNRAGQTKTVTYNAGNQRLSETWSPTGAAPDVTYRYDQQGRLAELTTRNAGAGVLTKLAYTYDTLGRLASETTDLSALVPGLEARTVAYRYDKLGRRSDLVYPDLTTVSYDYDVRGRVTTIDSAKGRGARANRGGTPLAVYDYSPLGRISKLTRDNGVTGSYTYDMAGQLTDITHAKAGAVLAGSRYTLDVLGRRTAQTREDGITERYSYDTTGQVVGVDYGNPAPAPGGEAKLLSETFAYDLVGNRTHTSRVASDQSSTSATYTANTLNQYSQIVSTPAGAPAGSSQVATLAYDANGNLIDDSKQRYGYDAQNRLITVDPVPTGGVIGVGAVRAEFFYDARNRCVLRKYYTRGDQGDWILNTDETCALTYDTGWNLLAERRWGGEQVADYIHGQRIDEVLVSNQQTGAFYPLADALGSTVALTNKQGAVRERLRYDVFGRPSCSLEDAQVRRAATFYRFLFTGREWLAPINLNEHRYRYYNPILGRWLTTDPIGFGGGLNLYVYVQNQLLDYSDSLGLLRDCDQEHIDCFRDCWNSCPPWPIKKGDGGHNKYCTTLCLAAYMQCRAANAAEHTANAAEQAASAIANATREAADWIAEHQEVVVGTIIVIGGVAFIATTGGTGAVILVAVGVSI